MWNYLENIHLAHYVDKMYFEWYDIVEFNVPLATV